jgi:3'-phosphoadenosine 5'-phosphosulfate sulfotransferase (PAPS reductase)/FAD synthetase
MKKILQFSGGKDSAACLHMFRDDPNVVALWVDTGNSFPHVKSYVYKMCNDYGMALHVTSPEIPVIEWQEQNGLPADVVPWDSTPFMKWMVKDDFGTSLVPYTTCCSANIWEPMNNATNKIGSKHVIRGSKKCDGHVGVPHGFTDQSGIYYESPLWDWTDADVFSYIEKNDIPLPDNYSASADSDSLDCWCCTAYRGKSGTFRAEYLKDNYPELHKIAHPKNMAVVNAVKSAVNHYGLGG